MAPTNTGRLQTARCSSRGGASMGRGHHPSRPKDEPDVPEDFNDFPSNNPYYSGNGYDPQDNYESGMYNYDPSLPRTTGLIGLLNGRYEINCPDLEQWEQFDDQQFSLILNLQEDSIWGAYDFVMFSGDYSSASKTLRSIRYHLSSSGAAGKTVKE